MNIFFCRFIESVKIHLNEVFDVSFPGCVTKALFVCLLFESTSFRGVLDGLPIPKQIIGSLLPDGVPLRTEIQVLLANSVVPAHAWTI